MWLARKSVTNETNWKNSIISTTRNSKNEEVTNSYHNNEFNKHFSINGNKMFNDTQIYSFDRFCNNTSTRNSYSQGLK